MPTAVAERVVIAEGPWGNKYTVPISSLEWDRKRDRIIGMSKRRQGGIGEEVVLKYDGQLRAQPVIRSGTTAQED